MLLNSVASVPRFNMSFLLDYVVEYFSLWSNMIAIAISLSSVIED